MNQQDAAQAIQEMLQAWTRIYAELRQQHPQASEESLYQSCKQVMDRAVGL